MTTDLKGRIQAGFDELETEIQAREAAGQTKGKPRAVGFADDARNGPYGKPTIGARREYRTASEFYNRSRVDGKYDYRPIRHEHYNKVLKYAGAVRRGHLLYVDVATAMGENSDEAIEALMLLAEDVGVKLKPTIKHTKNGVVKTGFYIENTPKGINLLQQTVSEGRIWGRCLDDAFTAVRRADQLEGFAVERMNRLWRKAGFVKKIGTAGAIYALCEFCSDALGAISSGNVVEDAVSVQTPMPEQYRGEVSPADQKYFTKGSPEEAKFRAMLFYAGTQEGGFMGRTQEEWLEYAMRLRQAEDGIISPQAELKLRKALVEAYPEYQQAIQEAAKNLSNGEAEQQPDATRGIRSGGAEPLDEGQAGPTPSNRGRGNQSSGRTGF